ncbi:ATP-binding protein [Paenibacillus sp. P22]|uniref:ATP-binding protein n=1 Tax=Paenibacillus sp. P22 TaxID=483908 RepID=UPI00038FB429|nr:ATP-binding protein [Paenibacillus sp. P22]CDN43222.1 PAS/PAC sensor signal transduction histidine kinase [Paenibacillus sp. P22]
MSIKLKLSALISSVVVLILALNLLVFSLYSTGQQDKAVEQQIRTAADQIRFSMTPTLRTAYYLDAAVSERMRVASIAAIGLLGPRLADVAPSTLLESAAKLNLSSLSLVQREYGGKIAIKASSDSDLEGKTIGSDSLNGKVVSDLIGSRYAYVDRGTSLQNYWCDSLFYSERGYKSKLSFYYDGTADYVVRISYNVQPMVDKLTPIQDNSSIDDMILDSPGLVEITGINADLVPGSDSGQPSELQQAFPDNAMEFGSYRYVDRENDYALMEKASQTGRPVYNKTELLGKKLLRGYIPFNVDSIRSYVIIVSLDTSLYGESLNKQFFLLLAISITLLIVAISASYLISGVALRKLKLVIRRVNAVAKGDFNKPIRLSSNDEIGELAQSVNLMASNMSAYTSRLKESAEELRHTKEHLESLVRHTKDAIHTYGLDGRLMSANRAFETMLGWSEQELMDDRSPASFPPVNEEEIRRMIASVLNGVAYIDAETTLETKFGARIDVSTTASPIRDHDGTIVAVSCISRNVTNRKHTEELLRRTEKLSVVGQLAAGVAHEIRNPLTTLRGFVQMQMEGKELSPYFLSIMLSELDRINFIVSEFLVLSKPQANHYHKQRIAPMLEDMALLLEPEANLSGAAIELNLDSGLPPILCEPNQMKQVFVNVIKNGIESMAETGGVLKIGLHPDDAGYAVVTVEDQGSGISEEDLLRLGEPFFTSKEGGNGLGLMVSQRIVSNHKGTFAIRSRIGHGTVVRISLPVLSE